MSVSTWNCNHPSNEGTVVWLAGLISRFGKQTVHLLQECQYLADPVPNDYTLFKPTKSFAGILLPSALDPTVTWASCWEESFSEFRWTSALALGQTGVLSAYFAHRKRHEEFLIGMDEARKSLEHLRSLGCTTLIRIHFLV